jgi:molybdate/tungstate transport system substrate-binding protein
MLRRRLTCAPIVGAALALTAACSSSTQSAPPTSPSNTAPSTATRGSGPVDVLYAGSLVTAMKRDVAPAFHAVTGYTFSGVSGDSGALANEIKGETQQGDVLISASASKDTALEGDANGSWVSWYASFANSTLVLGYNPNSKFAAQLKTQPWYDVITKPGFLLGRTDPTTDPKGTLTVTALNGAATSNPATKNIESSRANVFPETTLVARLQSGQLDAGFFYAVEAASAGIPTVPLTDIPEQKASYTITELNKAPHPDGAQAFISFLLGSQGTAILTKDGITLVTPPTLTGTPPEALQPVLSGQ